MAADTNRNTNKIMGAISWRQQARPMPFRSPQSPRPESNPALTRNPVGIDLTLYREVEGGACQAYPIHCAPRCRARHLPRAGRLRGSTRLRWRETDAESADRATLIRVPMSDNTLNKALRTWAAILARATTTARTASARPRRPCSTRRARSTAI